MTAFLIGELLAAPLRAFRRWKRRRAIWELAEQAADVHHTTARRLDCWLEREIYGDNIMYSDGGPDD